MSLEVQKEILSKMKVELKPSRIYWFVDPGMSGEDFDKRKIGKILELREKREVNELWVTHIDRIGRECRRSLLFFLEFSEDGGVIRTPERAYSTNDLVDILFYTIESYGAQSENRRRAARANASKLRNFRNKKWNKSIPLGYCRDDSWIRKVQSYEPIIKDIFDMFLRFKTINSLIKFIHGKYGSMLSKPITRDKVKRILTNPVYVGRPSFGGATLIDEQLRYIDDETFNKCQDLLGTRKITDQKKPRTLAQLALCYDLTLLDFIEEIAELHHKDCGGILVRNGTRFYGLIMQQAYRCVKCGSQFRIPTKSMMCKGEDQKKSTFQSKNPQPTLQKNEPRDHCLTDFLK
jgi:DNA invertase Pin-like site-specific DNA recombinase